MIISLSQGLLSQRKGEKTKKHLGAGTMKKLVLFLPFPKNMPLAAWLYGRGPPVRAG